MFSNYSPYSLLSFSFPSLQSYSLSHSLLPLSVSLLSPIITSLSLSCALFFFSSSFSSCDMSYSVSALQCDITSAQERGLLKTLAGHGHKETLSPRSWKRGQQFRAIIQWMEPSQFVRYQEWKNTKATEAVLSPDTTSSLQHVSQESEAWAHCLIGLR